MFREKRKAGITSFPSEGFNNFSTTDILLFFGINIKDAMVHPKIPEMRPQDLYTKI